MCDRPLSSGVSYLLGISGLIFLLPLSVPALAAPPVCETGHKFRAPETSAVECGTPETMKGASTEIEDRIRHCAAVFPGATKKAGKNSVTWFLVSRKKDPATGKFHEVWKDTSPSGLLWGDVLEGFYPQADLKSRTAVCQNAEGVEASAAIRQKRFDLPSFAEFQKADDDGIGEVVPDIQGHQYRTASPKPGFGSDYFLTYNGDDGLAHAVDVRGGMFRDSVRCVGR
jgi:hypothetical protein